jgi:hypothetical protein
MKAGARELLMPPDEGKAFSLGDAPLAERVSSPRRFIDRTLSALGRSGSRKPLSKEAKAERELRQFRETCQAVEDFNHDVAEARKDIEKAIDKALGSRQADPPMLPQQAASLVRIVSMRAAAAYLARRLQPRLDQAQWTLFLLLVNAIAFFHFYAHLFEIENGHPAHQPWLLWIFLLALAVATAQVMRVWWTRLDQRRLDYRALAEALRVRRVWAIAGIDASVADSYLGQLRGEMAWARRALLHLSPPPRQWQDDFARLAESDKLRRLRCVGEDWIREQVKQFEDGHKIHHRLATVFRTGGFFVALVGWGIWLLPFVERAHPDAWIIIGSGLLVVFGGMLIAISERRSHEELAKQYERMLVVFKNGQHELAKRLAGHDISGAQAVLHALGREAITENAQWLILRRARPFELHIG